MISILKRVGTERPYLLKGNACLCDMAVEDENILLWNVIHFQNIY